MIYGCAQEPTESTTLAVPAPDVDDPFEIEEMAVNEEPEEQFAIDDVQQEQDTYREPQRSCTGARINFDYAPFNLDKIIFIRPLGDMSDEHVTPIDHQYWRAEENELVEIYSPGDGFITLIERMGTVEEQQEDWRIIIEHTCTISSIYIHIDTLAPKLVEYEPTTRRTSSVRIPVKAGEVIGWYDFSVDYNVVNEDITIGLLTPELYEGEPWKIHTQDPFLYFNEPLKSQLEALSLRTDPPLEEK